MNPNYIAIEGCIGVGKTTLCHALANCFSLGFLLETVEENPFLADFYRSRRDHAFKTQTFFLISRYKQQQALREKNLLNPGVVSDYFIAKDKIFAELTLEGEELNLYNQLYQTLCPQIQVPDVLLYLRAPLDVVMERIKKRDRTFERDIDMNYLVELMAAYDRFFAHFTQCPVLVIDTQDLNFPGRPQDVDYVANMIRETLREKKNFQGPMEQTQPMWSNAIASS